MQKRFESDPLFKATLLLLQERIPKAAALYPHPAELSAIRGISGGPEAPVRVLAQPRHADTGSAAAVERPIPRHGHERGRRQQPLEGPRRHPLARRQHLRQLGHVLLHPRRGERGVLVDRAPADAEARRRTTRRSSPKRAPNFAGATTTSNRTPRSSFRRRTTSSCAGCASPTARGRGGRSTSRATRKSRSRRLPRTRCIRRSPISSCRPRSSRSGRPSCARAGRARTTSSRPGCST